LTEPVPAADRRLLERYCRRGDEASFNTFYQSQAPRLWRYLCARGSNPDAAHDLIADAFLRFLQVVCRDPRYPAALLYRIAGNLLTDAWRSQKSSPLQSAADTAVEPAAADSGDDREYLRALMNTLPEYEQNLLLLRYWIGLTHKELAGIVEKPEGTVRRQCAQALQTLKRRWQEDEHG